MSEKPSTDDRPAATLRAPVHPTHDPDHAAALLTPAAGLWCRQCDRPVAYGSETTDVGVAACPAYRSRPIIITGVAL